MLGVGAPGIQCLESRAGNDTDDNTHPIHSQILAVTIARLGIERTFLMRFDL